jgi:hypothetical protein
MLICDVVTLFDAEMIKKVKESPAFPVPGSKRRSGWPSAEQEIVIVLFQEMAKL